MTGERGLEGLKAGDQIVVISRDPRGPNPRRQEIKTAGRVWVTTQGGLKYAISDGEAQAQYGYREMALTVPQYQEFAERRRLLAMLDRWGMNYTRRVPGPERELTLAQLRQVAALLETFEDEEAGS